LLFKTIGRHSRGILSKRGRYDNPELPDHPFFIATLFVPPLTSTAEQLHPLILAYLQTARACSLTEHHQEISMAVSEAVIASLIVTHQ
jgi:CTP synthase (UTP-ammonia lyase)